LLMVHVDSMNHEPVERILLDTRRVFGPNLKIVAFGQYAEVFPDRLLIPHGCFDACISGEPEQTLTELAIRIRENRPFDDLAGLVSFSPVTGLTVRHAERELIQDLDTLPFPAYDVFNLDAYAKQSAFVPIWGKVRWGWILSSRGCPFHCLFCSPTLRKSCGGSYRAHSARYIADLAEKLVSTHGCNAIAFEDDIFSFSRERTLDLCDALIHRRLNIRWTAQTHLSTLDEELIRVMHNAGCSALCMGVEAGSDEIRAAIKSRSLSRETIQKNVELLKRHGIQPTLYFMIGNPGETLEQMEETLKLALELKPMTIQLAFFTPYPGSRAWEDYMSDKGVEPELSHYNRFTVNLSAATRDEVLNFYQRFYRKFYLNPDYIWRYLSQRLPYTMSQKSSGEWRLLLRSLAFIALPYHGIRWPKGK